MIKKYTLLNYISPSLENHVNPPFNLSLRVSEPNRNNKTDIFNNKTKEITFIITRNFRLEDNFGIDYLLQNRDVKDIRIIFLKYEFEIKNKQEFFDRNFYQALENFKNYGFNYQILNIKEIQLFLKTNSSAITDFNPLINLKIPYIDCNNVVPAYYASTKQEYNAMTFRNKVYPLLFEFLTEFPVCKVKESEGIKVLKSFIQENLNYYAEYRNQKDITSHISKYLNWGFISSQRAAIEVIKSSASDENKEAFLEELIIRRELSENFCLYNSDYKSFSGIPLWAKETLKAHEDDLRIHNYSVEDFEYSRTASKNWNSLQEELITTGRIHPYARMYWAKKILEWSPSPDYALKTAIYLNDKYAYDAPSPNGYTGILWAIGGLHDRPFANRLVTGKIRPMGEKFFKKYMV